MKNAPKKRELLAETLKQQQQLRYDNDAVSEVYDIDKNVVRPEKRPAPVSPGVDTKDELSDIMKNSKKKRKLLKNNYDMITMAFAKVLGDHIDSGTRRT